MTRHDDAYTTYTWYDEIQPHIIKVPCAESRCPVCLGSGEIGKTECSYCDGNGHVPIAEKDFTSALDDGDITQAEFDTLMEIERQLDLLRCRYPDGTPPCIADYWQPQKT